MKLSSVERQNQITSYLQRNPRLIIEDICKIFAVSEATARRDLEELAAAGRIQRIHGGAIAVEHSAQEAPILHRQNEQTEEKQRIGQAAAALIKENETIFLGSGTTVLEVARALRGRQKLTVITNSLPVINVLSTEAGISLIALGGMLRESELSFIGHITEQALAEIRADKVIIGTHSINLEHGLTHEYLPETMTDRAILKLGSEIIVLADHTKFGRTSTVLLATIDKINTIVTGSATSPDYINALQEKGVTVITA
jgi:DeoR/GlpR family transcriptional regulator of sugar metabolism